MSSFEIYSSTEDGFLTTSAVLNKTGTDLYVGAESSGQQNVDSGEYHGMQYFDTSVGTDFVIVVVVYTFTITQAVGEIPPTIRVYIDNGAAGSTIEKTDYKTVINAGALLYSIPGDPDEMAQTYEIGLSSDFFTQINKTGYTNTEFDAVWGGGISSPSYALIGTVENGVAAYRPKLVIDGYRGLTNAELINCEIMGTG